MKTTVAIEKSVIKRLDTKRKQLGFPNRSALVEVIIKRGLDFIDELGYDKFIGLRIGKEESEAENKNGCD